MSSFSEQLSRVRVANNFIKSYGKIRFHDFLSNLEQGLSGAIIAKDFGVTRERVRQWKNSFGKEEFVFYPSDTTLKVLVNPDLITTFPKNRPPTKKTQIKNFVKKNGINVFSSFVRDLQKMVSGEKMGTKYSLSRERVRQLKNTFGVTKRNYHVYSNVNALRR